VGTAPNRPGSDECEKVAGQRRSVNKSAALGVRRFDAGHAKPYAIAPNSQIQFDHEGTKTRRMKIMNTAITSLP